MLNFILQFDFISALLLSMIVVLTAVVGRYSLRYLNGEQRQGYFYQWLAFTFLSVSLMVLSGNLGMLIVLWFSTSMGLHRLLLFFPERPRAVQAAWKKFLVSRLGDAALIGAAVLTYRTFGTLDFEPLFAIVRAQGFNVTPNLNWICFLFAIGAMTKSAQIPFHFWLPETMETPTPVSAFMHAGIINGGGFLMIRLSPLMVLSEGSQIMVAVMGAFTACFGALVMITQNDIKKKLAYSTISQMGVMMFCCGLGLYSVALYHILAHSFYKAHAFLSTGFLVNESKKIKFTPTAPPFNYLLTEAAIAVLIFGVGLFCLDGKYAPEFAYGSVLWLGFAQGLHFSRQESEKISSSFIIKVGLGLGIALVLCGGAEYQVHHYLLSAGLGPDPEFRLTPYLTVGYSLAGLIFLASFLLSELLLEPKTRILKVIYLWLWNEEKRRRSLSFVLGILSPAKNTPPKITDNESAKNTEKEVAQSLKIVAPTWPLQNTVAVNPFWFLRDQPFGTTVLHLSQVLGFGDSTEPKVNTLSEFIGLKNPKINSGVIFDLAQYCAGYLDKRQAISRFPWQDQTFWEAWIAAHPDLTELQGLSAQQAIDVILVRIGVNEPSHQILYMERLLASVLGWASQFQYYEWQRNLGQEVDSNATLIDLLAARMACDYELFYSGKIEREQVIDWKNSFDQFKKQGEILSAQALQKESEQLEQELVFQKELSKKLSTSTPTANKEAPVAQMVFCIDVRSEVLRRNIESSNPRIQTRGFAGFFGLAFQQVSLQESRRAARYPVLLKPAFVVTEAPQADHRRKVLGRIAWNQILNYFRNLRKNTLSSFLYVELFGALYIERVIRMTLRNLGARFKKAAVPGRFSRTGTVLSLENSVSPNQIIDQLFSVLTHMGLTEGFAEFVVMVGHGSHTVNNAFGSSLECGACGGHSGEVNARLLVDLLNRTSVRTGLREKGMVIPEHTQFIAAVHETVTDEVYFYPPDQMPDQREETQHLKLMEIIAQVRIASKNTQQERLSLRSPLVAPPAKRRSTDWSETRPEWGLAGNACFVVAPRDRTVGVNLQGRSFLHDYHWISDQKQGYKTLELIMTAPMVVTHWINLQYYASVMAPQVFGSGNKILHNLVNEAGVCEGNGGDLRIGLPLQSVHDGRQFVHEPLRLSVVIEAPREALEQIIAKHQVVRELVENGWLHLLQLEPETGRLFRRTMQAAYVNVSH